MPLEFINTLQPDDKLDALAQAYLFGDKAALQESITFKQMCKMLVKPKLIYFKTRLYATPGRNDWTFLFTASGTKYGLELEKMFCAKTREEAEQEAIGYFLWKVALAYRNRTACPWPKPLSP